MNKSQDKDIKSPGGPGGHEKTLSEIKSEYKVDEKWFDTFFKTLTTVLVKNFVKAGEQTVKAENRVKVILSVKYLPIWIDAFTHETFSADNNYERLEYMGDAFLKLAFPQFLTTHFPDLDQAQLTNINSAYMSKDKAFQSNLTKKLGLYNILRIVETKGAIDNIKVSTDLLESFFGAIYTVGEKIDLGLGYRFGYQILESLLEDFQPEEESIAGNAKTQVQQKFSRFNIEGVKAPEEKVTQLAKNQVLFELELSSETMKFFKDQSKGMINIKNPVLASVTRATKKAASKEAYEVALKNLTDYGLNEKAVRILKHMMDFTLNPDLNRYLPELIQKLRPLGFVEYYFDTPSKLRTPQNMTIQFIARKSDNKVEILGSIRIPTGHENVQAARIKLVTDYLGQK
jgi:dsRNA-specific ribonuclease